MTLCPHVVSDKPDVPSHWLGGSGILEHTPGTRGLLLSVSSMMMDETLPVAWVSLKCL